MQVSLLHEIICYNVACFSPKSNNLEIFKLFSTSSAGKKRGRPSKNDPNKSESGSTSSSSTSSGGDKATINTTTTVSKSTINNNDKLSTTNTLNNNNTTTVITERPPEFIEVFVNDRAVKVAPGSVIIQACSAAGIDIPRFCYHERLAIAGNCRMCLVQVEKMPKLIASCSQPVAAGMRIQTDSPQVKKAREGVMEFLLANHPLDCAICDQGGECDLQDQAMAFGSDRSRLSEGKRAVENKDFGPLIKTSMNRCIHCTRCVRFGNEIAGLPELGTTGRGNDMQIGTYVQSMLGSELSANIVDLCPVGALTSKPYAFAARPWELRKTESVDVMDAVGSAVRIDTRGVELMRIQPRTNDPVNEEWLSDKSRFVSDGLKAQRLTQPAFEGNECSWGVALSSAAEMIKKDPKGVAVIAGPFADAESLFLAKCLVSEVGKRDDHNNLFIAPTLYDNYSIDDSQIYLPDSDISQYRCGLSLAQMESIDCLFLIGSNLRHEAPLLNARIRKAFLKKESFSAAVIGCSPEAQLNFDFDWLGDDLKALRGVRENSSIWNRLREAQNPAIIVSSALLAEHVDSQAIFTEISRLAADLATKNPNFINSDWNGLCWVPRTASHVASRLLGYNRVATKSALSSFKTLLMIGSPDSLRFDSQKVIYLGHHADRIAPEASVILPTAAYPEKSATFVNLEGRVQRTQPALAPPGDARHDWAVIRALSEYVSPASPLPYDTLEDVRFKGLAGVCTELVADSIIIPGNPEKAIECLRKSAESPIITPKVTNLISSFTAINIPDFYLTDVISRASATMAKCSLAFTAKVASSTHEIDEAFESIVSSQSLK